MALHGKRGQGSNRMLSTCSARFQQASPEEILRMGFKKMESRGYQRTEADKKALEAAGAQLGMSKQQIGDLYDQVNVGAVPYERLSPDEKAQADMEEVNAFAADELEDTFEFDDLPPLGHMQLHEHRVQREYNRIAAYDLPQLGKYATPYNPPADTDILRFKYTSYMGEKHPGEAKVVVSFQSKDLGLDDASLHKFRLLCGTRYNPTTDEVKMSCSRYPEQAQNKRFLGQTIRDLLTNARDKSDTFEDIPLDYRHAEAKIRRNKPIYPNHQFPKEWERPQDAPKPKTDLLSRIHEEHCK